MKKLIIITISTLFLFAFTQVEKGNMKDTPGLIQAIGNAGSDQFFTFRKWDFTKVEMPNEQVENIQLELEINTSSISCDWKDLEKGVKKKKDYFFIKKFPKATVSINGATANNNGTYTADAVLTLKTHTRAVPVTFTISDTKPYQVKGEGVITRQDFGFTGGGPKDEVPVLFEVVLPL